ncbi:transposon Ty3-G Gag-Pol polyprotein [Trichonephila clavipes]|nr:transposon Ty3-G Gag-Pol polyprotein [Trichonephila clavipes]
MEPLFKREEFNAEFEIAEKYREKVLLWQFRAKKKINEFSKLPVTSTSLQTTLSQSQDEHFRNTDNIRIKVPKYHITRFYGDDASKWLTFWNSFETAVHNNESLNKVDKFNYLKVHLGGSALNTAEGFPISAKAYDEAVELLKNRFANPEILIQAHMNKILSLQPLRNSNDLRSFRKFFDNCNVQLRSLNSLGVPSANYGKILCPMLLKLFPSDLVLDYNKLQQKDSGSDIQQLLSFLTQSLTAREQTKSSFELCNRTQETKSNFSGEPRSYKQQNEKSFHTASELLTAPVKDKIKLICIFCHSMTRNSNECEYVMNMSLEERKNILLRKGACFNCLRIAKHLSRNCPINKTKCEICSGLHHKFFCFKQQKREIGSMSTDLANQNTGEVFLQTLAVFIENGNSKQLVRAILDTGSQKSYISEYAAKFIELKRSDIVGKLFTGEVKQLSEGLTAVNTRLGWTVMGKLSCESKFESENSLLVHSLFTNREKISDVRELDSLGIKDPSEKKSKLELQDLALKHFENTVLREDEAAVLNHHFKQAPEHLEKAAEKLIDSMFVDNCVASVDSSEELESFQRDSTELLALDHELSKPQRAATSSMQPCSSISNGGAGLEPRAETSGHQQTETSSMQPCSSFSDGEAGVEPRLETLELPDVLISDGELQQPGPRRSRYGTLETPKRTK